MGRKKVEVATPAIALRRNEAAAALGVSVEVFDKAIRDDLPVVRVGGVVLYPVAAIDQWIRDKAEEPLNEQLRRRGT